MKQLTVGQKRMIKLIVSSGLSTAALLFAILASSYFLGNQFVMACSFFMGASFVSAANFLVRYFILSPRRKFDRIKCFGLTAFYLALTASMGFAFLSEIMLFVTSILWLVSLAYSGILDIVIKRKARFIVYGIMKIAIGAMLIFGFSYAFNAQGVFVIQIALVAMGIAIVSFGSAMLSVFSGVRSNTLSKIIRKTYAIEIIYGLLVLIVASSLMFMVLEDNMSFSDALWYCFAIVTTIGFGDFTALTLPGRLISVALGIYGIIVVALITSIIVNFYNEVSANNSADEKAVEELPSIVEPEEKPDEEVKQESAPAEENKE